MAMHWQRSLLLWIFFVFFVAGAGPALGQTVSWRDAQGNLATVFVEGSRAYLRVTDAAANLDPAALDTVTVQVSALRSGDSETVTLTETGPATGAFTGSIPLAVGGSSGDGLLGTEHDVNNYPWTFDTLTAAYGPASANAGTASSITEITDAQGITITAFPVNSRIYLRVRDAFANTSPGVDTTTVLVFVSTTDLFDGETVTLTETGGATGIFEGSLAVSSTAPSVQQDGVLKVLPGIVVNADHNDLAAFSRATATAVNEITPASIAFVDGNGQPLTVALEYSTVALRVVDAGYAGLGTVRAHVTSDLKGDQTWVQLAEDWSNPGTFRGSVYVDPVPPSSSGGYPLMVTEDPGPPHRYDTIRAVLDCGSPACPQTSVATAAAKLRVLDAQGNPLSRIPTSSSSITLEGEFWSSPAFNVTLTSLPSGDTETLALPYAGGYPYTLLFRASLPTTQSPSASGDGQLHIDDGGSVVASHDTFLGFGPLVVTTPVGEESLEILDRWGHPTDHVLTDGLVRVRAVSPSADLNPNAPDALTVHLRTVDVNGTTRDTEDLELQETGPSTGVFSGQMKVTVYPSNVIPNDGTLQAWMTSGQDDSVEASFGSRTATARVVVAVLRFVDAAGADLPQAALGDTVHVQVESDTYSQNPALQEMLTIRVLSEPTGDQVSQITLLETGPSTSIFEGSFQTMPANGPPNTENQMLEAQPGDMLHAEHGTYFGIATDTALAADGGGPVNFPPAAVFDYVTTSPGTPVTIDVLANDSDPDGDALTLDLFTQTSYGGTLAQTGPGTLIYTPPPAVTNLVDSFLYRVVDARGAESVSSVSIWISNNRPPVAAPDFLTMTEDGASSINVVANDSDPDGDPLLLISITTPPAHGTAVYYDPYSIIYRPDANYYGTDSLTYMVSDGHTLGTALGTLTVTINPFNDWPAANDDVATMAEDTMAVVYVLDNDTDVDGDSLSIIGGTQPSHGSVFFYATAASYTPAPNYNGPDSFTYSINDGHGGTATATVNVTVTPVNDPPVGVRDDVTTLEDTPVTFNVLNNDTDVDGDTLTLLSVATPAGGTVTWSANGTVTFTPMANFAGPVTFTYGVGDGHGMSASGTVRLTITPVNDPPVAVADSATTAEDTAVTINVLTNDTDVDADMLTVTAATQPAHGSVASTASAVTYTPAANYNGADSFTYTISDGRGGTATAQVNVTVTAQPDPPAAATDFATTLEDTPVTINVLANDSDPDGDTALTTSVWGAPSKGTAVHNPDHSFTYTPRANLNGFDSFTYQVTDSTGRSSTAVVSITITPVNDPPFAGTALPATAEDTAVTFNVLANASDVDGDSLTVTAITQPANGSAVFTSPNVTYTPAANFNGTDVFTYTISDGHGGTATGSVIVTVTAVNDPPAAAPDSATTAEDTAVTINVLANDFDVEANSIFVTAVTQPAHGAVTFTSSSATYVPAANSNGPDSFTYSISDGHGGTATGTVSVSVTPVNDRPAAAADSASTAEDTTVTINVLANDTDVEGDSLTVTAVTQPAHGTASFTAAGATYAPAANYYGPDAFTYSISDGHGGAATGTVSVNVTPVYDPPAAANDSVTTAEETAATVAVLANDTDVDGNSLTVTAVTQPAHGSASFTATNATYAPATNYNGPDSFTYSISDGKGGTATATVNVMVTPVNDPPAAAADSATTAEDTAVTVNVLTNDSDVEGDSLTVTAVTQPAHGSTGFTATNATYTPAANYSGPDSFTYSISDGRGGTATGTVNVNVTAVNDPPAAGNDSVTTAEDTAATVAVLANDTDAEGDSLTVTAVTQPAHGTATFTATNATYTPAANYNGPDSFTYSISDGNGGTATGTVSVNVTAVNDPPVAGNDSVTTTEETAATVAVLANDTDVDGDSLAVTAVTQPAHGTASRTSTTVTYTPAANYNGPDSFTYSIGDGRGGTATGTVSVTVTAVNDPPVAGNDSVTTAEDTAATVAVLANDTDVDGDSLTVTAVTQPAHGTAAFTSANVTYTPAANYNGPDSFTYSMSDGRGGTATGTVSVTVTAVNDPPVAGNDSVTTAEETGATVAVLANDTDPEGASLMVLAVTQPAHGSATLTTTSVTYTPAANYNGPDSFTYTVSDGYASATGTVSVTVTPVNDPPVAVSNGVTTPEDTAVVVAVLANDTDVDGDSLTVTAVTQPAHGAAAFNATNATYTPAANYNGPDSFTYSIGDGHGGTATAAVSVTVTAVNDPPVAVNDSVTTSEGVGVIVPVLANDSDVEGSALTVTSVSPPAHGTAAFTSSSVTYTPAANFNGIDSFTYTVSDGAVLSAAIVTVTVKDALERVAVLATNSVWIQTGADVLSGDVVVNQAGAGPFLNGAQLSLAGTVTTPSGWDLDADSISIAAGTAVASDVFFNQLTNAGTITGQQISPLTLPVFSTLPAFLTATPNTTDVSVANNGTRTLAPGTYRDLIIGRKATVTFTGGTYHFHSIRTSDIQAKLLFSAASTVRVQQTFKTLGTTTIGPASGASVTASGIVFYIGGINGTGGGISETPKAVEIGTDNVLTANIYAPNGTLWIADRTQARGSFFGRDVLVGPDVQVTLQPAWAGQ
jgi:hypothetical protein